MIENQTAYQLHVERLDLHEGRAFRLFVTHVGHGEVQAYWGPFADPNQLTMLLSRAGFDARTTLPLMMRLRHHKHETLEGRVFGASLVEALGRPQ